MTKKNTGLRVLIIAPMPTHRPHSGNRARLLSFVESLQSRGWYVDLIWHTLESGGGISTLEFDRMAKFVDRLFVVSPSDPLMGSQQKLEHVDALKDPALERQTRWCIYNFDYCMVIVNYVFLSYLSESVSNIPFVIDTHDVLGARHQYLRSQNKKPEFYDLPVEEEKKGLKRADFVIAITHEDQKTFKEYGINSSLVIGHMPIKTLEKDASSQLSKLKHFGKLQKGKLNIGVFGSDHRPVLDGMEELCSSIDQAGIGDQISLFVAGLAGTHLKDRQYIEKLEFVPQLQTFFDLVDLIVIPVDYGSGLKIKTVEALTSGKPVLATIHASIGLQPVLAEHCIENSASSVLWIIKIIQDRGRLKDLASSSQALGTRYLQTVSDQFDVFLNEIALKEKRMSENKYEIPIKWSSIVNLGPFGVMGAGSLLEQLLLQYPNAEIAFVMDNLKSSFKGISAPIILPDQATPQQKKMPVINMVRGPVGLDVHQQLKGLGFTHILKLQYT